MKTIMITGGAGFIGGHFVRMMLERHPGHLILNVDAMTYAGSRETVAALDGHERHLFVEADIRDRERMMALFRQYDVLMVANLAAESHVDRSIQGPAVFLETNVMGTQVLLDAAMEHWKPDPSDRGSREFREGARFLQVSTDEVYGALGAEGRFTEDSPLAPSSPYSASKAAADLLVQAYYKTYGLPAVVTRCSNNYGSGQHPEKLIPLMAGRAFRGERLPVYGDGLQVRDWIHVLDHCRALDLVLHRGRAGEVYNIGGDAERTNLAVVRQILEALGRPLTLIEHVADRPGHDRRYAIDASKIRQELGWSPTIGFEEGLQALIGDWGSGTSTIRLK